jgi:folate-dependent phosphoribosylglycinamide formyltransferase PurN
MKTYFLFHENALEYLKADLAAARIPVAGYVVVGRSRAWLGEYLWKRVKRFGWRKVFDEVLFRLYWAAAHRRRDRSKLEELAAAAGAEIPAGFERPPVHHIHDINSDEAAALLADLRPDVCVVMLKVMMREKVFGIPPLGMLVYHPGIVPEYRGSHAAFWATLNRDWETIGWSLLRVDKGVDTGPLLAQGRCEADPRRESHIVMQHRAHLEGIPAVVETLRALAAAEEPRVETGGRRSRFYTQPGLTDYLRLRRALRLGPAPPEKMNAESKCIVRDAR